MSDKIKAKIIEINDGPYYEVLLDVIPKKGEYISFYSYLDQSSGHEATHKYEVVDVLHHISDVTEKIPHSKDMHNSVALFVKPSSNSIFN